MIGLTYAVHHTGIDTVSHKSFESRNSQNENDTIDACIERSRKSSIVYHPEQYYTLVAGARKAPQPYKVTKMSQEDII